MHNSAKTGAAAACVMATLFTDPICLGGAPGQAGPPSFKSGTEVVALNVSVTDRRGQAVLGLGRGDFAVYEDGVPQHVTFFGDGTVPIDLVLLIDTSSSMLDKLPIVRKAALGFVSALRQGDRASVVAFSDVVHVLQALTEDLESLRGSLPLLHANGGTALYTALYVTLTGLTKRDAVTRQTRRSSVVVLTDGEDSRSLTALDDLERVARLANVVVYPISVISSHAADEFKKDGRKRFLGRFEYALGAVARETGGRAFFPIVINDLSGIYDDIAQELSTQYLLGYETTKVTPDSVYRKILVQIPTRPDARPRTRTGYYAGQSGPPAMSASEAARLPSR